MGLMDFFKKKNSGEVAKDRIKLLLISDRANCSPDIMENIKADIIKVISKYMEIDTDGLDIQITQTESDTSNGTVPALCANIPIRELRNGTPKKE
ncbi:MAG: cell division topological specificity factor MinE [Lachnospiraceae bacterium]|nr:cell division topological specificity factor MinE [Lachnospiraceae bacterium]